MKIKEKTLSQSAQANNNYRDEYAILIDGKQEIAVMDGGEPEDNSLGRDLNFVYKIVGLMKRAYEAGKSGETFEVVNEEVEEIF